MLVFVSLRFCASDTSFCRFSRAIRSRSDFERNLGFAAAASRSLVDFSMSSIDGGCFRWEANPFLTLLTNEGPNSSSEGGGGGGSSDGGGGGGRSEGSGGGGGGSASTILILCAGL